MTETRLPFDLGEGVSRHFAFEGERLASVDPAVDQGLGEERFSSFFFDLLSGSLHSHITAAVGASERVRCNASVCEVVIIWKAVFFGLSNSL